MVASPYVSLSSFLKNTQYANTPQYDLEGYLQHFDFTEFDKKLRFLVDEQRYIVQTDYAPTNRFCKRAIYHSYASVNNCLIVTSTALTPATIEASSVR